MAPEIVHLALGEKTGAEALRGGTRVAHLVGGLERAPSRGSHAWVHRDDQSLADGGLPELYADPYTCAASPWVERDHLHPFAR